MLDIYLASGRAFARLKDKPNWLVPLVIVLVFNMLFALLSAQYMDRGKVRKAAIEAMQKQNLPEEQVKERTDAMDRWFSSPLARYGFPPLGGLVSTAIVVLFFSIVYNVSLPLFGGTSDFKRMWAIVCNASLVAVPATLVRGALVFVKRSAEVTTSLALAAPGLKQGFLKALLTQLDIFEFWKFLLIGVGLTVVFGVKKSKSYTLVFVVWVVIMLILSLLGMRAIGR